MKRVIAATLIAAFVAGCQTTPDNPEDQLVIYRADGLRSDTPERIKVIDEAKAVCVPRAEALGLAAAAPINHGGGLAGGILTGIDQRATAMRVSMLHFEACLAERGLRVGPRRVADAHHISMTESQRARR